MNDDAEKLGLQLPQALLLEGVVTTFAEDGSTNIAPMGPLVNNSFHWLLFRPFQTSTTYQNLKQSRQGVLHVTDDVELIAKAAIGQLCPLPLLLPAEVVEGNRLADACRWYEFRVESIDERKPRAEIVARVVHCGRVRDFFGFNRAKHAVVEAAILATRVGLLPTGDILAQLEQLAVVVEKTGGTQERSAFECLHQYVLGELENVTGSAEATTR